MTLVLTTSDEILRWAGAGASSTIIGSSSLVTTIGENAEKRLCAETRWDLIAGVASLDSNTAALASKAAAIGAALEIVNYSRQGYFSKAEQQTILSVLSDEYAKMIKELSNLDFNNIRSVPT